MSSLPISASRSTATLAVGEVKLTPLLWVTIREGMMQMSSVHRNTQGQKIKIRDEDLTWAHLRRKRHNTSLPRLKPPFGSAQNNLHVPAQALSPPKGPQILQHTVAETNCIWSQGVPPNQFSNFRLPLLTAASFPKSAAIPHSSHKPHQWQMLHLGWEQDKAFLLIILRLFNSGYTQLNK